MDTFYLWSFRIGDNVIATRGRTQDEAADHISKTLPRGLTVSYENCNHVHAGKAYSANHVSDWLHAKPIWLTKLEEQRAQESKEQQDVHV
jgi:hypothetical protein